MHDNPHAPLVVFVHGFLSQTDPNMSMSGWTDEILKFSEQKVISCAGLYWESESIFDAIRPLIQAHSNPSELLKLWTSAKTSADQTVDFLVNFVEATPKRIILLGHSLGGRIVLKTAERLQTKKLHGLIALASAVEAKELDLHKVSANVTQKPQIYYSHRDLVLLCLFGLASNPKAVMSRNPFTYVQQILESRSSSPAIGCAGIPREHMTAFESIDATPLMHFQYTRNIAQILHRAL